MAGKNYELETFKLIADKENILASEFGWVSDEEFLVWIPYYQLKDFMDKAIKIFGYELFDDGGFNANMQPDGVCVDICKMLCGYLNVEDVFPKEEYQH